jgi:hypothetical protein
VQRPEAAEDNSPDFPQVGVWVLAEAQVIVRQCVISSCLGPGIVVDGGKLSALFNTVAFSRISANVVVIGGQVMLHGNEIHGAYGDGVVSLKKANVVIDRNIIWDNGGSGVDINHVGGDVAITNNYLSDNQNYVLEIAHAPHLLFCSPSAELWAKVDGNHTRDKTKIPKMFSWFDKYTWWFV